MPLVEIQGVGSVEFPDDMSPEQISQVIETELIPSLQEAAAQPQPTAGTQSPVASARTAAGAAVIEPALSLGSSVLAAPLAGLAGLASPRVGPRPSLESRANTIERVQSALTFQPRTEGGASALDKITFPLRKFTEGTQFVGGKVLESTGSPGLATAVDVGLQSLPAVLFRGASGVVRSPRVGARVGPGQGQTTPLRDPAAQRPPGLGGVSKTAPPSLDELSAQATAAYKRAADAGIEIAPDSFAALKNRIGVTLNKEGVDPTLHPSTTAAFKRIAGTKGAVSLEQLETLRRIANDAKGAQAAADRRLAATIVDEIDDYVAALGRKDVTSGDPKAAGALREARNLFSRKMKAQEIGRLIERAEISAPNFSASGMENALRIEFRALAKDQRRMRRFTAEEQAAIKKVAVGGKMENTLRMLGKFAPTGVISSALSSGAGFVAGGPAGAVVLPAAGFASRALATRMTVKNARRAEELMRKGPQGPRRKSRNALIEQRDTEVAR